MSVLLNDDIKNDFEEDFSTLEVNIAQSIKQKCIDYCYDLKLIPKIKQECIKRKCYFTYAIERNNDNEIEYIKIIPVFSLIKNNKDEAFCEISKLPNTYKIQEGHGYQVETKKKDNKIHCYKNRKQILSKIKKETKNV